MYLIKRVKKQNLQYTKLFLFHHFLIVDSWTLLYKALICLSLSLPLFFCLAVFATGPGKEDSRHS